MLTSNNNEQLSALIRFDEELLLMNYSINTRKNYRSDFHRFLNYYNGLSPQEITSEQIREYMLHGIKEEKISATATNGRINAIKFYFEKVLKQERRVYDLPRPKKPNKLPNILSEDEVYRLLAALENIKHRAILYLAYSAGFRISEVVNLKLTDIDSERMLIHIRNAKGYKDRYVSLSPVLLENLRLYFVKYKPKVYLFEGQYGESSCLSVSCFGDTTGALVTDCLSGSFAGITSAGTLFTSILCVSVTSVTGVVGFAAC